MPSHRFQVKTTPKVFVRILSMADIHASRRASTNPSPAAYTLLIAHQPNFPCPSSALPPIRKIDDSPPHVHDISMIVVHRDANGRFKSSIFRLFFKRHTRLSYNRRLDLKGNILIMRVASRNISSVVNMHRSDAKVGDFIVASLNRLSACLRAFQGPKRKVLRGQVVTMPRT
ncbi:hypothetical protein DFH07DRAFT_773400 [Mycena maculata]|uniref:Uncharacterized protein n=1 Tax=Mycena maculata TaxID=230809 RepID=A0AAD7NCQ9_9AGAR|nr:hypothetical protein DFH07DRAFT_773400 [Mycena maculata]